VRDILGSDEELEHTEEEDGFQDIDDLSDQDLVPSVLGGSFSTTKRGIKPKKVRSRQSWIYRHGFKTMRNGVLYWKCTALGCKCSCSTCDVCSFIFTLYCRC